MKIASFLLPLLLLALPGSATAQSITDVSPDVGPLGTTLTITGSGFGGPTGLAKPGVFLQHPGTLKKFALEVLGFSDTAITAKVTKAAYGDLDLVVQPKGGAPLTAPAAFVVPAPADLLSTPEVGTLGTTVTITGSGLLGAVAIAKPKVQLVHPVTLKKFVLKVLTFSDTEVTAVITKAVLGDLQLQLIPKGGTALVVTETFTVPLPNITEISPDFAFADQTVTLTAEHVGNKKPKVKLGKKSAKVLTFSDTQVTFLMPKKLPKGVQTLQLINKIGTATQIGLINQGDVPDTSVEQKITATLGKTKFVAGSTNPFLNLFAIFGTYDDTPAPSLVMTGRFYDPVTDAQISGITLVVPFDPNTFTVPVGFVDTPDGKVEYELVDPEADPLFGDPLGRWSSEDGSYTIAILSVDPPDRDGLAIIRGAFSGTLGLVEGVGNGIDPYELTNGEFRCLVQIVP